MTARSAASHVFPQMTRPLCLALWLLAGWLGGLVAVYVHYSEYRGRAPEWLLIAWARGGIPISLVLLAMQLGWRAFERDALTLIVGLALGATAYAGFTWVGTRILPLWMSDSLISMLAGLLAVGLPLAALRNAQCLRNREEAS